MRMHLAGVLTIVALMGACREGDRETGAMDDVRDGEDTIVTSETVKDTTIVTADTSIDVDTVKKTDNIEDDAE
jgi:hypothetical protein